MWCFWFKLLIEVVPDRKVLVYNVLGEGVTELVELSNVYFCHTFGLLSPSQPPKGAEWND